MGLENVNAESSDFNQMIFENDPPFLPYELELQTNGVLMCLLSSFIDNNLDLQSLPFAKSLQHIEESLHLPINMNELGKIEQLSTNYFSDQFKTTMGVRPQEYILQRREILAKRLLRQTSLTVSEIAENVGQTDVAYFSRIFKKRVGLSPNNYRKQL
jgi:AraC-like DNA-binding protein